MRNISLNNRIRMIILACLVILTGMIFSINISYARYINEVSDKTVSRVNAIYNWDIDGNALQMDVPSYLEIDVFAEHKEDAVTVLQKPMGNSPLILEINYPEGVTDAILTFNGDVFPKGVVYSSNGSVKSVLESAGYIKVESNILMMEIPEDLVKTEEYATIGIYFFKKVEETIQTTIEEAVDGETVERTIEGKQLVSKCIYKDSAIFQKAAEKENNVILQDVVNPIITKGKTIKWWLDSEYKIKNDNIRIQYLSTEGYVTLPDASGFTVTYVNADGEKLLNLTAASNQMIKPGTYRIMVAQEMERNGETYPIQSIEIPFFVVNR